MLTKRYRYLHEDYRKSCTDISAGTQKNFLQLLLSVPDYLLSHLDPHVYYALTRIKGSSYIQKQSLGLNPVLKSFLSDQHAGNTNTRTEFLECNGTFSNFTVALSQ